MRRRNRLSVTQLEDRATPAAASYAAGTLTLTAATGDILDVSLKVIQNNSVPGFLHVQNGATTVFESTAAQPVKSLVVKAGAANTYAVNVLQNVALTSLNVTGAPGSTGVSIASTAKVTGNFNFTGTGAGEDGIALLNGSAVGGNVALDLKDGAGLVNLAGGVVGGSLTVTGGKDNDEVKLFDGGKLTVGGSVAFNLGDGNNIVHGVTQDTLSVGKNFTYTGGAGEDVVNLSMFNDLLHVGGSLSVTFGGAPAAGENSWTTGPLEVGGGATFTGAGGTDSVFLWGTSTIGGNLTVTGGDGANSLNTGGQDYHTAVGGSLAYTGGAGYDQVRLDDLAVGKDVSVALGGGTAADVQKAYLGTQQGDPVVIGGKLTVTTGDSGDDVRIFLSKVGGGLVVNPGGGADTVYVDDSTIAGPATFDLGAGKNTLEVESQANNGNGTLLTGSSAFQNNVTVTGGAVDDTVYVLPKTTVAGTLAFNMQGGTNSVYLNGGTVGGNLTYTGGAGADTVYLAADGNVKVNGSATFTPGDGTNVVQGFGAHDVTVGTTFTYTGGANTDSVYLSFKDTDLSVGGDVVVGLGGSGANEMNTWSSADVQVGGNFTATGVGGKDSVYFEGDADIGGTLTANLGEGENTLGVCSGAGGGTATVGLGVQYTGGAAHDNVYLDALTVGTNVNLSLGAAPDLQQVTFGVFQNAPVVVNGNVTVNTGESNAQITIDRTLVGGDLLVTTGSKGDHIWMNDTEVDGSATFNLGGGIDQLDVDTLPALNQKPLDGEVHIGGNLTVNAGDGDDSVDFSNATGNRVVVGGNVKLTGGTGQDTFNHWQVGNIYLGTTTEDFELGENF